MKNNKGNFIKLLPIIFKQGIKEGKIGFIALLIIGVINCGAMYFNLKVPEVSTNIAYKFITEENLDFIQTMMPFIVLVIILLVFQISERLYSFIYIIVRRNLKTSYEIGLTKKLSSMTWESYETHDINNRIEMVKRDGVNAYLSIAVDLVGWLISSISYMIIYIFIVVRISWLVGLTFGVASLIYMFIGIKCGNKVYKTYRDKQVIYMKRSYLFSLFKSKEAHQDGLVNRLYRHISNRWRKMNDAWMNESIKADTKIHVYNLIPSLIFVVIAGSLLYLVVKEIQEGRQDVGYFTLIITTIINFRGTINSLGSSVSWFKKDFKVYQDYYDLMIENDEMKNTEELISDKFEIEFKNVNYVYPQSEHKALNNLNIKIRDHETIAIVGVNGSGKTTFVNMLMELSKKYNGDILVDKKIINNSIGVLRNSCSCIFQDFLEYEFSIKENISLGDLSRELTDKEVWDILDNVGLKEFVKDLPKGINTMLGQINNGIELSKGQWQRLAVARLLANKNSKIWILDEPTAYLDPIGEIEMYDFIYNLKGNRTVIFISHRLGFAKRADRIIVFKDGRVIEDGTHNELIKDNISEYAAMYEKQRQWYE